jgi:predicted amidophosphoribosyltransferase
VTLAVLLNIKSFGLAVLSVLVLLIAVSVMYRHPTRQCHRCGKRVRLTNRICSNCGYDFEPVRMTR